SFSPGVPPAGSDPYASGPPPVAGGYAPPAAGGYPPAAPGSYAPGAPPMPGPAGPAMSSHELVPMVCMPAGLFCLFLLIVAAFLPWVGRERSISGIGVGDAGIFTVLCLLVASLAGLTYRFKTLLPTSAAVAAGFGVFCFFFMLGAVLEYGSFAKAGV